MLQPHIKPRKFQTVGANFLLKALAGILADDMGLGKSLQAIMVADHLGLNTLIISPASLKFNWMCEIKKFVGKTKARFTVGTYDDLKKLPEDGLKGYDFVVFDEAHGLKNLDTKRTKAAHNLVMKHPPKYLALLTGTPIENRVGEYYSLLLLLCYHNSTTNGLRLTDFYGTKFQFEKAFSRPKSIRIPNQDFKITKFTGTRNVDGLKRLLKGKYLRRLTDEVLELPPLIEKMVSVKMPNYKTMDAAISRDFAEYASKPELSTAKADSAYLKAPLTAAYVNDIIEEVGPVVVFSDHRDAAELIFKKLCAKGLKVRLLRGGVSVKTRFTFVQEFQAGKLDALVCTIGAAREGLTMTGAADVVFNDPSWVPTRNAQARKRIHRMGQTKKCRAHYIIGSSVDEYIFKVLQQKLEVIKKAT